MFGNTYSPLYNYGAKNLINSGVKKISWSNLLDGTQKTLNIINQAIPVFYQMKPIYNNAKTIFKVMNVVKEPDIKINKVEKKEEKKTTSSKESSPTFFL